MATVIANDLGASSGRVLRGIYEDGHLTVDECARFRNGPIRVPTSTDSDYEWDVIGLWHNICQGLIEAAQRGPIDAIGIDTWGVDYARLDEGGRLIRNPYCYRSHRTTAAIDQYFSTYTPIELYTHHGTQFQPFNTMFQLLADRDDPRTHDRQRLLLLPDLFAFWLTGEQRCEVTNASTTGLLNPQTRQWDPWVCDSLTRMGVGDIPTMFAPLIEPGHIVGRARIPNADLRGHDGQPPLLVAVGSHDTASAVVAIPAVEHGPCAYISSGTWSLVGIELDQPVCTPQSQAANFTNELGIDGTVRYLKNVMGMWVVQELLSEWHTHHPQQDLSWPMLDRLAHEAPPNAAGIDMCDPVFFPPGPMRHRIDTWLTERGQQPPSTLGGYLRLLNESLARAYRDAVEEIRALAGVDPLRIHIVGGGSQNRLLCQLTADTTGLPVTAGPVEATSVGNMLVQLRAIGALNGGLRDGGPSREGRGDLGELRRIVAASSAVEYYTPRVGH